MIPKPDALSEHFFDAQQGLIYTEHEFASSDVKRALKLQAIEFETAQRKENEKIDIKMNASAKSHKDELERERTLAEHKLQEMSAQINQSAAAAAETTRQHLAKARERVAHLEGQIGRLEQENRRLSSDTESLKAAKRLGSDVFQYSDRPSIVREREPERSGASNKHNTTAAAARGGTDGGIGPSSHAMPAETDSDSDLEPLQPSKGKKQAGASKRTKVRTCFPS